MIKRIFYASLSATVILVGAWLAGFDFDTRGFNAFFVYYITMAVVLGFLFIPKE